jgi:hypothetical protein
MPGSRGPLTRPAPCCQRHHRIGTARAQPGCADTTAGLQAMTPASCRPCCTGQCTMRSCDTRGSTSSIPAGSWMSAVAPAACWSGSNPPTLKRSWSVSTPPPGWSRRPSPRPASTGSGSQQPPPNGCPSPTRSSIWSPRRCQCRTGARRCRARRDQPRHGAGRHPGGGRRLPSPSIAPGDCPSSAPRARSCSDVAAAARRQRPAHQTGRPDPVCGPDRKCRPGGGHKAALTQDGPRARGGVTADPVRMPGNRMRILAGRGASRRHHRHVQPPVTGVFFGAEVIPARLPRPRPVHHGAVG